MRRIAPHPSGGAVFACNIVDGDAHPPAGISVLNGPGLVLRIDDNGVPMAADEGPRAIADVVISPTGAILLACQFGGEFTFASALFRAPNGQDQAAMRLLHPCPLPPPAWPDLIRPRECLPNRVPCLSRMAAVPGLR